uniref:Uncharacterized protein n=1 Tax=Panagrolaimus sp. JU765 TaxID=591449 RepID=A0AC34QWR9_9BILA
MSTSDSFFDDHGSSVIDTLSADSVLTTVPCTEIPEVSPRFVSSPVIDEALKSHRLKANPVHQASFYKSVAETVESLDSHEMQRGIWVNPNSSPFFSILHLSCRVGGITAVNMTTGESVRKSLSIQSFNQTESEAQSSSSTETLVDEPTKIERNLSKAAQLKADLNLAWDEVCAELDKIERLFVDSSDVDLSSETEQCQRKVFGVYSPVKPSTLTRTVNFEPDRNLLNRKKLQQITRVSVWKATGVEN